MAKKEKEILDITLDEDHKIATESMEKVLKSLVKQNGKHKGKDCVGMTIYKDKTKL